MAYMQAQSLVVDCMRWRPNTHPHREEILTRIGSWEPYELYVLANLAANAANAAGLCPVDVMCHAGDDGATVTLAAAAILMLGGACDTEAAHMLGVRLKACYPHDLVWLLVLACDAFEAQNMSADEVNALGTTLIPYTSASHAG
jgi:hypothetical protein